MRSSVSVSCCCIIVDHPLINTAGVFLSMALTRLVPEYSTRCCGNTFSSPSQSWWWTSWWWGWGRNWVDVFTGHFVYTFCWDCLGYSQDCGWLYPGDFYAWRSLEHFFHRSAYLKMNDDCIWYHGRGRLETRLGGLQPSAQRCVPKTFKLATHLIGYMSFVF